MRDPHAAPWPDPGLHSRVAEWTADALAAAGLRRAGESTLAYEGPLAIVLRTPVEGGRVFTKASIPLFAAEARTTRALAAVTPDWLPTVIDVEPDEGWLLMADLGERLLGDEPFEAWPDGLALFAQIQRTWLGRTGELLASGAMDRPLEELSSALPGLLEIGGLGERLPAATSRAWPAIVDRLQEAARALGAIGLPDSILHGDLHPWNIARTPSGLRIFDWSDTAVGPPVLDLAVYLGRARPATRAAILDAYLQVWSEVAPRAVLLRAAELAMPLGAIDQTRTYQRIAAARAGPATEFAGADAGWVENAIAGLQDGLEARFSFGPEGTPG
jgi:hypothetical protein